VGAAVVILAGCGGGGEETRLEPTTPVKVRTVERRTFTDYFHLIGTAKAAREATLVFEVGGVVEKILAPQGSEVRAGGGIARLNDDLLGAALAEAEAARDLAVDLHTRSSALVSKGGISEFELSRLAQEREMAEARFQSVKEQHERTVLRAPFDGVVDNRFLDEGDYAAPGVPFGRYLDLNVMKIRVPIPEVYLDKIHAGDGGEVSADPFPNRVFEGTVTFVSREVDSSTRTINVEVTVPNEDRALRPGMTVRVRLAKDNHDNALVVPQDAVVETEHGPGVYLARSGAAVLSLVRVGTIYGQMALIDSGLTAGDTLIVVGNRDLVTGEPIDIIEE